MTGLVSGLLLLAWGAGVGLVIGAAAGYLTRHREARAEHAELVRKANAALDAIALEMAEAWAPHDFELWSRELKGGAA